jgi:hypothetical protein
MNTVHADAIIESYVTEIMRHLPGKERQGIALELRSLLGEMLAERAGSAHGDIDDAMVLDMLRTFGTPAEVAARYHTPGIVIIPAQQTRTFAWTASIGIALQWALTLPRVFHGQPLGSWWLGWGLGALWWPGFLVMSALIGALLRGAGLARETWKPRDVDPARVDRRLLAPGLVAYAAGVMLMAAMPWIVRALPAPWPERFAFDADFLRLRAWPALLLWSGHFALVASVFVAGRWSAGKCRLDAAFSVAWLALLAWWLADGAIFQAKGTDDGARFGIVLVVLIIALDLALKLYRKWRVRAPRLA